MDPYISFCNKKIYTIFYRDVLFDIYKSEMFFVLIYFEINYNISEIL